MKSFLIKLPEGMLDRWKREAQKRKMPLARLIRESVNREIDEKKK